jgi:hypothetical protein
MKRIVTWAALAAVLGLVAFSCSRQEEPILPGPNDEGITRASLNGTETLGDIPVALAPGTGIAVGGVGTRDTQPGTIVVTVPGAATVKQVLIYWQGDNPTETGDDQIIVEGNNVIGTLIGGPTLFYVNASGEPRNGTTFRADITSLGLVTAGVNNLDVSGMDFSKNEGAGVVVIYDDGSGSTEIKIKDGQDFAYYLFAPPLDTTVPQTFTFAPATVDRQATLSLLASSVEQNRPNVVAVTIGAVTTNIVDPFQSLNGSDFDAYQTTVNIPAGATQMTLQCLSEKDPSSVLTGGNASLTWLCAAMTIETQDFDGCTPGYWKNIRMHGCEWEPTGHGTSDDFDTVFGTDYFNPDRTLLQALQAGGGGYDALGRHGVAALLSAAHPDVDYGLTEGEVIAAVQAGNKDLLEHFNEQGCPLNNCK